MSKIRIQNNFSHKLKAGFLHPNRTLGDNQVVTPIDNPDQKVDTSNYYDRSSEIIIRVYLSEGA